MNEKDKKLQVERRQHIRVKKNFILTYYKKGDPSIRHDSTQLKNIGKGGMCFITGQAYEPSTQLIIELRTPYLADTTILEGVVLESHEKLPNIIYETRLRFSDLTPQAQFLLDNLAEYFQKEKGENQNNE
ncbi:MAG: PilZ domain-containing protein [Candidatus Omnitrophota bacterium]